MTKLISKLQLKNKYLCLVVILLIFFSVIFQKTAYAYEFKGKIHLGIEYNSSLQDMSLYDRILFNPAGDKALINKTQGSLSFEHKKFSVAYSILSNWNMIIFDDSNSNSSKSQDDKSRLDQYLNVAYTQFSSDKFYVDYSFSFHYNMKNYENLQNSYMDLILLIDFYYDYSDLLTFLLKLKSGFYVSLEEDEFQWKNASHNYEEYVLVKDEDLSFLTGPSYGLEIGGFYYPYKDKNYIQFGIGAEIFYFEKDYKEIIFTSDGDSNTDSKGISGIIEVENKYIDLYFPLEFGYFIYDFNFTFKFQYSFFYWFKKDIWFEANSIYGDYFEGEEVVKRRIDHNISVSPEVTYTFNNNFSLKIYYIYILNNSTIGKSDNKIEYYDEYNQLVKVVIKDYTDYNFDQHKTGLELSFKF